VDSEVTCRPEATVEGERPQRFDCYVDDGADSVEVQLQVTGAAPYGFKLKELD
jgi:hypothetical protein